MRQDRRDFFSRRASKEADDHRRLLAGKPESHRDYIERSHMIGVIESTISQRDSNRYINSPFLGVEKNLLNAMKANDSLSRRVSRIKA